MLHNEPFEGLLDRLVAVNLLSRGPGVFDRHSDDVTDALLIQPVEKILHVFAAKRPDLAYSGISFGLPLSVGLWSFQDDFDARKHHVLQHTIKLEARTLVLPEALEEILP
jgi:hypothetical protein